MEYSSTYIRIPITYTHLPTRYCFYTHPYIYHAHTSPHFSLTNVFYLPHAYISHIHIKTRNIFIYISPSNMTTVPPSSSAANAFLPSPSIHITTYTSKTQIYKPLAFLYDNPLPKFLCRHIFLPSPRTHITHAHQQTHIIPLTFLYDDPLPQFLSRQNFPSFPTHTHHTYPSKDANNVSHLPL